MTYFLADNNGSLIEEIKGNSVYGLDFFNGVQQGESPIVDDLQYALEHMGNSSVFEVHPYSIVQKAVSHC
jgi:hypothetical protein